MRNADSHSSSDSDLSFPISHSSLFTLTNCLHLRYQHSFREGVEAEGAEVERSVFREKGNPSRPFKSTQNSGRTCRTRTTCRTFLLETGIMLCAPRLALAWWGQGCFTRESARLMARVLSDEKLAELMAKCFAHCKFLETIVLHVVRVLHVLPLSLQVAKHPTNAFNKTVKNY